jgi:WD40 repeat protein
VTILGLEELWFESWKPTATITAALLDPDQNRSVELDESGIFRVRDLADGHELFRLPSTTPLDRDLAGLDPNGRWIASLDSTAAWRLRRIPGPDSIAGDSVKSGNPAWISFHPEQSRVAIGGSDASSPELWIGPLPLQGMTGVRRITLPAIPLRFAWSPSGTRLAVLCKGLSAVVVIDPAVEREVGRLELPEPPADFAWMPDARRILVASSSGVSIGDTQDQSVIAFAGATGGTTAIAVPDNGALMAVAGITGRLEVWDFKAARRITTIPSGPIVGLQWSADATRLVVQPEHSRVPRLAGFSLTRDVVHFVPPGATVLPDSPPGPLLRWDTNGVWLKRSGGLPVKLPANGPISGAAVSPNSEWIHVKTADGVVREWNLARLRQRLAALGLVW